MTVGRRILAGMLCLLIYAGAAVLDFYNAARYKKVASINGESIFILC